jgi:probable rRNA maturation factor
MTIDLSLEDPRWEAALGDPAALVTETVTAVFAHEGAAGEVSVCLADDATVQDLNARFRGKDRPTNVLSYETVADEAAVQGKTLRDHARHLLAHGLLHLLGYDHETDADASVMEGKERLILAALGAPDPYADHG